MSEINFIETDAGKVFDTVLEGLENDVGEPLYPGDERRIFGEALAQVIVTAYNTMNDACRQRLLRYARGTVLDALGENRDVTRNTPTKATTTLQFGVSEGINMNIIIPAGLRVTGDYVHYFVTDSTVVLYPGDLSVQVTATAENGGEEYNDIPPGGLIHIVDVSEVPLIDYVTNLEATTGGGDEEGDEQYRERIRTSDNKLSTAGTAQSYKYWALSSNPRVVDAAVEIPTEQLARELKVYDGHAFLGGASLLLDSLLVYEDVYGRLMEPDVDYKVTYDDELLTLELYQYGHDYVNIVIERKSAGCVNILPLCAGGEIPDASVLADVLRTCSADNVKPLTDKVTVEAPGIRSYDIELTYYTTRSNEAEVVRNIEGPGGAIERYNQWQTAKLGRDINPDELRKLILCPHWEEGLAGAVRVEITQPEYLEIANNTVAMTGNMSVRHIVKD